MPLANTLFGRPPELSPAQQEQKVWIPIPEEKDTTDQVYRPIGLERAARGRFPGEEMLPAYDYAFGKPARNAFNEYIKAVNQKKIFPEYAGLKGLLKSYKDPNSVPTGDEIAQALGVSPKTFREAARQAGYEDQMYPDVSFADILGFGIEGMELPLAGGVFAGQGAKGFKRAANKFSGLWDKKPRFEIDDSAVKMLPLEEGRVSYKLNEVIDHPELFKNYPELKNVWVSKGKSSYYSPRTNHIKIKNTPMQTSSLRDEYDALEKKLTNEAEKLKKQGKLDAEFEERAGKQLKDLSDKIEKAEKNAPREFDKSTLLHEIQHNIQEIERFAKGGSTGMFAKKRQEINSKISNMNEELSYYADRLDEFDEGSIEYQNARKMYDGIMSDKLSLVKDAQKDPFEQYKRLAGEAEARDVSARMGMSAAERAGKQPLESTGLGLGDLIIR